MKLKGTLDSKLGEIISIIGDMGKTTLTFALAGELASSGNFVITTTTTKIFEPLGSETPLLLLEADEERLIRMVP